MIQTSKPWMLVGSMAVDLWLQLKFPGNPTLARDIDVAIKVDQESEFDYCVAAIARHGAFCQDQHHIFRFAHWSGWKIDFIPFGKLESQNQRVHLRWTGDRGIKVRGFSDSFARAKKLCFGEGVELLTPSFEALWILKLFALTGRTHMRQQEMHKLLKQLEAVFNIPRPDRQEMRAVALLAEAIRRDFSRRNSRKALQSLRLAGDFARHCCLSSFSPYSIAWENLILALEGGLQDWNGRLACQSR